MKREMIQELQFIANICKKIGEFLQRCEYEFNRRFFREILEMKKNYHEQNY